ncbi:uncharacterized protein LOC132185097 [Corylus avellana]|uniref:uncharacterized protein LOC132185097 n=1 Tax=Corylus avellana TaxID=13451 RepID=UPI00286B6BE3|nr:uncharacterized protein LOC132185097 [Corylus avellana]
MNLLSWNCRGIGSSRKVHDLCLLVKENHPNILFIMETKCKKPKLEFLRVKLGYTGLFVVDPVGCSGGLALLWRTDVHLEIQNFSIRHINSIVKQEGSNNSWKLTSFYGHPDWTKRHESWALLRHLQNFSPELWLVIGDFNEIVSQAKKFGTVLTREGQMAAFREALQDCSLADLGYRGSLFTWTNSRSSDHKPICLRLGEEEERQAVYSKKFKIEASWMVDEEYQQVVENAWVSGVLGGSKMQQVRQKLASCQADLSSWSKRKFGDATKKIKQKTRQLELLQRDEGPGNYEAINMLKQEIDFIMEQEDIKWKQRSKHNWYQHGDRNTPFFHAWASHRRRINQIKQVMDESGTLWKKSNEIGAAFVHFYTELFTAGEVQRVHECLEGMDARVTEEMNEALTRTFTVAEVEFALYQMHPSKSPGPDGFSACFYQNSWHTVQGEVCQAVLDFFNFDVFDKDINATNIALIPKVSNPTKITKFRPITLCNIIYKLIAKVLANRMKRVLPTIISSTQSAFILGRLITDNILVAFEALHTMDGRMKGREGHMALKLDMSKAYDRVEWDFLELIMCKIGFSDRWVKLTMTCVRTVSYAVVVHGQPYANWSEWVHIQEILDIYERASDQKLNKAKTSLFFSRNTHADTRAHILSLAVVSSTQRYEKYLGLPALIGRSKGHKENDSKMAWMSWKKLGRAKEKGGMGFRDLECFNVALLAKQGWRLIHNTDSLVARILQEKYYPNASFQTSNLGRRPSYAWRSIWSSKKLLQEGMMWRVGDGKSIKIWHDRWIPSPVTYAVQSPVHILESDARVCSLIDENTKWWNKELVYNILCKEEADIVCSMPICPRQQGDCMVWAGSRKGDFSVRSAYHFAKSMMENGTASSSSSTEQSTQVWRDIWRVRGPRVLTSFLRKLRTNILPTKANLHRKGVIEDPTCPICKLEPETVRHVLWNCPPASGVWLECPARIQKCIVVEDSFLNIFQQMRDKFGMKDLQFIVITARLIWLRRNEYVFDGEFMDPSALFRRATEQLATSNSADQSRRDNLFKPNVFMEARWKPPNMGSVKANWDAAVDRGSRKIGIGIVLRDYEGKFVAPGTCVLSAPLDPAYAEAYGVRKLADFLRGFRKIEVEGDALEIVQAMRSDSICMRSYGRLVEGPKHLLNSAVQWEAKHVRRCGNKAAHS